MQRRRGRRKHE